MKVHIYTTSGCGYCVKIKELMNRANVKYTETIIGSTMTREEFKSLYPNAGGYPFVLVDDQPIGGLIQTVKLFYEQGLISPNQK